MPTRKKAVKGPTPVEAIGHDEGRKNIPTSELSTMVEGSDADEVRYPRDPSLDPQLVWKGKDEQDAEDLVVPSVPIYIQEKIVPQALVENLRDTAGPGEVEPELTLFDSFDGLDALDSVDFYEHEGNWSNRMILGDSLTVMTSLAEKEDLRGKVQMIYVDPPYGIKFGSNWQVSTRKRDVKDGKVEDASRQPEQVRAFRDTWELGIHSYLSYLRDRLTVARELLTESGSCFVQIGDENVHLVRSVMDEVFGSENFVSMITYLKTSSSTADLLPGTADYVIWFGKNVEHIKYRQVLNSKELGGGGVTLYTSVELEDRSVRSMTAPERAGVESLPPRSRVFGLGDLTSQSQGREKGEGAASWFPVTIDGAEFRPSLQTRWKTNEPGMKRLLLAGRVQRSGRGLGYKRYLDDFAAFPLGNVWTDTVGQNQYGGPKTYVVQTSLKAIQRCMLMVTDPGDLVLDPTCGSGTTAYVAEQWGRRWITTDTSRVALALARTRLMAAKYPSYLLADSLAGAQKEVDLSGGHADALHTYGEDVRKGFVYKRVPHITLKSIAQNPDIVEGMSRDEIDAAISRHADTEMLVDQPYVDNKRVRVSGRFTVESLSPHRMLAGAGSRSAPAEAVAEPTADDFASMILDNLRAAGVQNTFKGERLSFDTLEPYAGSWIHAVGEYTEDGESRRVAVSIGPEYGTIGPDQISAAAIEASKAVPGFDLVLLVGFAFDPHAWERSKEINGDTAERKVGRMRVLLSRANPDLAMGDDLLKKTGAGNLFTVFGEPDVELHHEDGQVVVEIHGLDVYDPTTGEVRASSTDDIAAWFVDTNYDGKSFFVRHAYFTGGQKPYESLSKALKADIDAEAWASLYSTVSRPFASPDSGHIAVKVINHYGDEIVGVYEVG
jgi:adenine-specific DNA-methyltransferase